MEYRMMVGRFHCVTLFVVLLMLAVVLPAATLGQLRLPTSRQNSGLVLTEDRDKARALTFVKSLLELKRYADVARQLGRLLENPRIKDFFLPAVGTANRVSFVKELRRIIGSLPAEGKKAYELQFGEKAKRLLDQAIHDGDVKGLQAVALRYTHTKSGYEASYLLGQIMLDQGRPGVARSWLSQLRDAPAAAARFEPMLSLLEARARNLAGEYEEARQVLLALKKRSPEITFQLAGTTRKLFSEDKQALQWLAEMGGSLGRAKARHPGAVSSPLMKSRSKEIAVASDRSLMDQKRNDIRSREGTPLPMLHPLAVGDVVLKRTAEGVQAIEIASGKPLWKYPSEGSGQFGETNVDALIWQEAAFGRISTDGRAAFLVEDAYAVPNSSSQQINGRAFFAAPFMFPFAGRSAPEEKAIESHNKLTAIDVPRQGKLLWSVGGADGGHEPELAGAFFLGPPAVVGERLYVLVEIKSTIHLATLERRSGRLTWLQKLADVETPIHMDPFRRMAGASPVVAGGIAVCPTSCGGVIAIDVVQRSLLWAYQHKRRTDTIIQPNQRRLPTLQQGGRWADASLMLANGRVILSPLESDDTHCLDMRTGRLLWKIQRGASLYVACVHKGQVIRVAGRHVNAKYLTNGKKVWEIKLPVNCRPSGRGVLSAEKDKYYLPLTDSSGGYERGGRIVEIDLIKHKITDEAVSQRDFVPGNLIFHRGVFISQGTQYLEIFDQLAVLEKEIRARLKKNPDDANAWVRFADIKRNAGKLSEALDHMRQAYELSPNGAIRDAYEALQLDGTVAILSEQTKRLAKGPPRIWSDHLQQVDIVRLAEPTIYGILWHGYFVGRRARYKSWTGPPLNPEVVVLRELTKSGMQWHRYYIGLWAR